MAAKNRKEGNGGRDAPAATEPRAAQGPDSEGEEERTRERKDHVLQTRVPKALYRDLVDQARRLRVPVSNLVRNILEDSVRMVENIVDGGLEIAEALGERADARDLSAVVGWQPMLANRSIPCANCGGTIEKGEDAFTSVGAPQGKTFVICEACKCKI